MEKKLSGNSPHRTAITQYKYKVYIYMCMQQYYNNKIFISEKYDTMYHKDL